jgi:hypothetical protein
MLGVELLFVSLTRGEPVPKNLATETDVIEFPLAILTDFGGRRH